VAYVFGTDYIDGLHPYAVVEVVYGYCPAGASFGYTGTQSGWTDTISASTGASMGPTQTSGTC
jgi:hypothetical protein